MALGGTRNGGSFRDSAASAADAHAGASCSACVATLPCAMREAPARDLLDKPHEHVLRRWDPDAPSVERHHPAAFEELWLAERWHEARPRGSPPGEDVDMELMTVVGRPDQVEVSEFPAVEGRRALMFEQETPSAR
jgi:hypothetical protein